MRHLGIPIVVDHVIQQAIAQVLGLVYEPNFSDGCYGFRPGRSAHQSLQRAQAIINEGYKYCIDLDLESLCIHPKTKAKLRRRLKELTSRSWGYLLFKAQGGADPCHPRLSDLLSLCRHA